MSSLVKTTMFVQASSPRSKCSSTRGGVSTGGGGRLVAGVQAADARPVEAVDARPAELDERGRHGPAVCEVHLEETAVGRGRQQLPAGEHEPTHAAPVQAVPITADDPGWKRAHEAVLDAEGDLVQAAAAVDRVVEEPVDVGHGVDVGQPTVGPRRDQGPRGATVGAPLEAAAGGQAVAHALGLDDTDDRAPARGVAREGLVGEGRAVVGPLRELARGDAAAGDRGARVDEVGRQGVLDASHRCGAADGQQVGEASVVLAAEVRLSLRT